MAQRKGRRAYLKRYRSDYINVTQGPRSLITDETKPGEIVGSPKRLTGKQTYHNTNVDQWYAYHDRVKTTSGPKHNKEPIPDNTFTHELPMQRNVMRARTPKHAVADTLHVLWQGEMNQGLETYYCAAVLHRYGEWVVKLFCSGDTYFLQEEDGTHIKRSCFYTRERALRADETNKITWIERIPKVP